MCGFVGYFSKKMLTRYIDLEPAGMAIRHRGPDMTSEAKGDFYHVRFNRLSINDLSDHGMQPFEHKGITVFVNGEVYNHLELKKAHVHEYTCASGSDSEILPFLYYKYGMGMLDMINGMFSMIILDNNNSCAFLVIDRFGVKPLFYIDMTDKLIFASEIKAFRHLVDLSPDCENIFYSASMWRVPSPLTPFKDIFSLRPGECLYFNKSSINLKRWYNFKKIDVPDNREDIIETFTEIFDSSVSIRLTGDVPIGGFVSGGLDSTSIAVSACKQSAGKDYHLFNAYIADKGHRDFNEIDNIGPPIIGKRYNMPYHCVKIDFNTYKSHLLKLSCVHDEILSASAIMIFYIVAEYAKRYVKVLLDGTGGDELTGGYYWQKGYHGYRRIFSSMNNVIPYSRRAYLNLFRVSKKIADLYRRMSSIEAWHIHTLQIIANENMRYYNERKMIDIFHKVFEQSRISAGNDIPNIINFSNIVSIIGLQNCQADRGAMYGSIESRNPFEDYRLVEFCLSLPSRHKGNYGDKSLIRNAFSQRLPPEILSAGKSGPMFPLDYWFNENREFYNRANSYIKRNRDLTTSIFSDDIVSVLLKNETLNGSQIHYFLSLIFWYKYNFEKSISPETDIDSLLT